MADIVNLLSECGVTFAWLDEVYFAGDHAVREFWGVVAEKLVKDNLTPISAVCGEFFALCVWVSGFVVDNVDFFCI